MTFLNILGGVLVIYTNYTLHLVWVHSAFCHRIALKKIHFSPYLHPAKFSDTKIGRHLIPVGKSALVNRRPVLGNGPHLRKTGAPP